MTIWERFSSKVRDAMDREGGGPGAGGSGRAGDGPPPSLADRLGLLRISDEALGMELERRRRARGRMAHRRPAADDELDAMNETRRARLKGHTVSKAYAALELESDSTRGQIDRAYRTLLRQYHPDRHLADDEQHKSAIALANTLTDAYLLLLARQDRR